MTDFWQIGDARIYRIVETEDAGEVIQSIVKEMSPEALRTMPDLIPRFADEEGRVHAPVQSFLIRADGKNILMDTGSGNHKPRNGRWGYLNTDYLEKLGKTGVSPEQIDYVVCSHLHSDHVGWNTVLSDGRWVPTFQNAVYIFPRAEVEAQLALPKREQPFIDSVAPVLEAGMAQLAAPQQGITPSVSLVPTEGHTAGHTALLVTAGGQRALLCGDLFYHISQILHPEWGVRDPQTSVFYRTRLRVLADAAQNHTLLFLGHADAPLRITQNKDGSFAADTVPPSGEVQE